MRTALHLKNASCGGHAPIPACTHLACVSGGAPTTNPARVTRQSAAATPMAPGAWCTWFTIAQRVMRVDAGCVLPCRSPCGPRAINRWRGPRFRWLRCPMRWCGVHWCGMHWCGIHTHEACSSEADESAATAFAEDASANGACRLSCDPSPRRSFSLRRNSAHEC